METLPTILLLLAAICSTHAFSKYGRTCKDICCLPSETCVLAEDSCAYYQEKNKECGSYPTCKKSSSVSSHSPGIDPSAGAPDNTATRKPYAPPPSINTDSHRDTPYAPSAPSIPPHSGSRDPPAYNPSGSGGIYPNINGLGGNNDPSGNRGGSYDPSGNRGGSYDPSGNRGGSYDPSGNRGGSYDPYGNRGQNPFGTRDDDRNKGSSGGSSGGSSLTGLLNFLRGGGSSSGGTGTRYGSGGSGGGSGLSYGDIFNALSGGNRGGASVPSSSGGFSDILNSFGNRGSGGNNFGSSGGGGGLTDIFFGRNGNTNIADRFGPGGASNINGNNNNFDRNDNNNRGGQSGGNGGGFISSLSSLFGDQLGNTLLRNALSNRGGSGGGGSGSGSDLINSFRYGGLFNENNGHNADPNKPKVTVSGAGPGGYPTQAPAIRPSNVQNVQSVNNNQNARQQQPIQNNQNKPAYGWSV